CSLRRNRPKDASAFISPKRRLPPNPRSDPMNLFQEFTRNITRRHFFAAGSHAVGWAALASLLDADRARANTKDEPAIKTHFPGKAKNVIYLHMVGGPPQMDLYDYKPKMGEWFDKELPDSVRMGLRQTAKMVDNMCFIRSIYTEAINHEPAITFMQTGNQVTGRPCLGAWVSYGLGSLNSNLPTFVVLVA